MRVTPSAHFDAALGEFILPYDTARHAAEPDALVLDFLSTTYAAAAETGGWTARRSNVPLVFRGGCAHCSVLRNYSGYAGLGGGLNPRSSSHSFRAAALLRVSSRAAKSRVTGSRLSRLSRSRTADCAGGCWSSAQ